MPKIDLATVRVRTGSSYPEPFRSIVEGRKRQALGDPGGLNDFGVNRTVLPPGGWSSQRHWHSDSDELVLVLEGEVVLVDEQGRTPLRPGDAATFAKGDRNGHHLINESADDAVYLEIGSRRAQDRVEYPDIDMIATEKGYFHRDGTPY